MRKKDYPYEYTLPTGNSITIYYNESGMTFNIIDKIEKLFALKKEISPAMDIEINAQISILTEILNER